MIASNSSNAIQKCLCVFIYLSLIVQEFPEEIINNKPFDCCPMVDVMLCMSSCGTGAKACGGGAIIGTIGPDIH